MATLTFSPPTFARLESGDIEALLYALACYGRLWLGAAGVRVEQRRSVAMSSMLDGEITPEQRALLAAGCDLLDLLSATPQGREAIAKLSLAPLSREVK